MNCMKSPRPRRFARTTEILSVAAVCTVLTLAPRVARSETTPQARAAAVELFDAARRLMRDGKTTDACKKFGESYRLDPQLGALLHHADCLEREGRTASAYAAYREAAELAAQKGDDRKSVAKSRADRLEPRLSRLAVEVPPQARVSGLEITRDGLALEEGAWGVALPIDPGEHAIVARAPGHSEFRKSVRIASEGSSENVIIEPLAPSADTAAASDTTRAEPTAAATHGASDITDDQPSDGSTQRTLGLVLGGAGIVGVAVGGYFWVSASNKLDERDQICPSGVDCEPGSQTRINTLTNESQSARMSSVIAFGAGGAALIAGTILYLTAPSERASQARLTLAPIFDPETAGVQLSGAF
jgi:hypothetical protein